MMTRSWVQALGNGRNRRRRGATVVLAIFLMTLLVGMLAFSIDIGYLAASKSEIQRTADSAALAGCWQVYDAKVAGRAETTMLNEVSLTASDIARLNTVSNSAPSLLTTGTESDVKLGYLPSLQSSQNLSASLADPYRAVRVTVRKSAAINGQVPFFFARIFGKSGMEINAEATAAMAQQVKGFQLTPGSQSTVNLLPFALDLETWQAMLSGGGTDQYSFTSTNGQVNSGSDGIREVNLYPQGTGSPGNRGTVDIGGANNSTADIARQIVYGVSSQDLVDLGKPLTFGTDGILTLNGDTGISAGVKDELASIIGQTRIIPVFASVSGNGNNATYRIVRWVGVRILFVKLTGSMSSKKLIVQPASIQTRGVVVGDNTRTWSEGIFSPVVLVN